MPKAISHSAPTFALSVRQPYAWQLLTGAKPAEFRSWRTDYRGLLWIHASARKPDGLLLRDLWHTLPEVNRRAEYESHLYTGCILGAVELVDCITVADYTAGVYPDADPGNFCGAGYAWILGQSSWPLDTPLGCKGRLGLWRVSADLMESLPERLD